MRIEIKNTLYPELSEEGQKQVQDLMVKFEYKLKESATELMKSLAMDFYTDISHTVESDHWVNFRNKIVNGICDYTNKSNLGYDYAKIRKAIYNEYRDEIVEDLNQDLLKEIEDLKRMIY
jgi:nitrogenase subunit NifH